MARCLIRLPGHGASFTKLVLRLGGVQRMLYLFSKESIDSAISSTQTNQRLTVLGSRA